jgi:hypothetical protein
MAADLLDDFLKLAAGFVGRDQAHQAVEASVQIGLVDFERAIRRLSDNPKIGAMDHAEIVRDSVAEPLPLFGHGLSEEFEDLSAEFVEGLVIPVVGDVFVHQGPQSRPLTIFRHRRIDRLVESTRLPARLSRHARNSGLASAMRRCPRVAKRIGRRQNRGWQICAAKRHDARTVRGAHL